jgi:hypothetical protein
MGRPPLKFWLGGAEAAPMTAFLIFLAQGFAVLLLTAMVVAAWEQWRASQLVWSSIHGGAPTGPLEPSPTHADAADAALARMTRPGVGAGQPAPTRRNDPSWAETRPMIGASDAAAGPAPNGNRASDGTLSAPARDIDLPLN